MSDDNTHPSARTESKTPEDNLLRRVGAKVRRVVTGTSAGGAFDAPGAEARWTESTKEGTGAAYHTSCQVWFTIAEGVVNEVYYPHIDRPNTRDLQFLITDGESFVHEERRDLDHAIGYPETNALVYRLINSDRAGRYRIVMEIICDPHHSVLLIQTRVEILDESLRGSCAFLRCSRRTSIAWARTVLRSPAATAGARFSTSFAPTRRTIHELRRRKSAVTPRPRSR